MFFQILAKIEMTQNKNRLFGRHFETVQHFKNFFAELWFFIALTYMLQISLQKSGGKVVFLGDSMEPPWAPRGVKVPWSLIVLRTWPGYRIIWITAQRIWFRVNTWITRAVLRFRGLWVLRFVEHVVFMTGCIRNGLAAVCVWIFYDWVGSVQNHEVRSSTTTNRFVFLKEE